ncbi:uncharacterized protein STEHIDRAFT_137106 [Stereum hirsutum FP-91666 SS1]|uniref:uncharacterized protein n=1 Tax=Stereum hirsutum (strain FP-91666) TaxID=721885 RepID=UPI000440AE9B|nr:uncharacterized protein STEHIDRAFT_137106 [Stereum hirsutum FP-91666 SS1]EIM91388.1 hypothetical protein STEHIDRAFT_137106 [Stereum hirsutum FP-91666 SS1]
MAKQCGLNCDGLCENCIQHTCNLLGSMSPSLPSHGQDHSRSEPLDVQMLSTVFEDPVNSGLGAHTENHLDALPDSYFAPESGIAQDMQVSNGSNATCGATSQDPREEDTFMPPVTTSFDGFQLDATSNFQTAHWNDNTIYPIYAPHQQPVLEQGSYTPSNVQHPHCIQSPSFSSTWDNLIGSPQPASHQTDVSDNSTSNPYAEQYLLDIEQRGCDALSIHVRIPPSIPSAMYFDNHLMAELSQEADGTLNVRVHLPPGYANISSTFVHA